jgi:hypothetical protein
VTSCRSDGNAAGVPISAYRPMNLYCNIAACIISFTAILYLLSCHLLLRCTEHCNEDFSCKSAEALHGTPYTTTPVLMHACSNGGMTRSTILKGYMSVWKVQRMAGRMQPSTELFDWASSLKVDIMDGRAAATILQ